MNNLVEVSGHNLESSQTWGFPIQSLHYKPLQTTFSKGRGGEENPLVQVTVNSKGEKLLRLLSHFVQEFGLWTLFNVRTQDRYEHKFRYIRRAFFIFYFLCTVKKDVLCCSFFSLLFVLHTVQDLRVLQNHNTQYVFFAYSKCFSTPVPFLSIHMQKFRDGQSSLYSVQYLQIKATAAQ